MSAILITGAIWGIFEATVGYFLHLLPWMREVSVLKSGKDLLRFLVIDQLCGSLLVFFGMLAAKWLGRRGLAFHAFWCLPFC